MEYVWIKLPEEDIKPYWEFEAARQHMSHHMYRNSPFETDDKCGNCDGARCDGCEAIVEEAHYSVAIPCDKLEEMLAKVVPDLPEELRRDLVYDDYKSYVEYEGKQYRISWPRKTVYTEDLMKDKVVYPKGEN